MSDKMKTTEHKPVEEVRLYRNGTMLCKLLLRIQHVENDFGKEAEEEFFEIKRLATLALEYTEEIIALRKELENIALRHKLGVLKGGENE